MFAIDVNGRSCQKRSTLDSGEVDGGCNCVICIACLIFCGSSLQPEPPYITFLQDSDSALQ